MARAPIADIASKWGVFQHAQNSFIWAGEPPTFSKAHTIAWEGILTPRQQKASDELTASNEQQKSHLIHAVCGAGKTEILFEPIHKLLTEGKRICIAAPRVDVILELEPRFRAAFPSHNNRSIIRRCGTELRMPHNSSSPQPINCTDSVTPSMSFLSMKQTHFLIQQTKHYERAVKKAAKQEAPIHSVTATPSKKLIAEIKRTGANLNH